MSQRKAFQLSVEWPIKDPATLRAFAEAVERLCSPSGDGCTFDGFNFARHPYSAPTLEAWAYRDEESDARG